MSGPWIAALAALFLWWFSTGIILVVIRCADRAGGRARMVATLGALPVLGLGIWGYEATLTSQSVAAAYGAFLAALAIWGWIELAFLTGAITGPNLRSCPAEVAEWERFLRAWGTIAYHEMLLAAVLLLMWINGEGAANTVGLWTFTILYLARFSAKLNLYFGVPRINTEFIPEALAHLSSHFRVSRLNWVFPLSITGLTLAVGYWLQQIGTAAGAGEIVGLALLAAITALAALEHWVMVLPLPDAKLWRWMLPAPKHTETPTRREGHYGF